MASKMTACSTDQDCQTINARCYPGLPADSVASWQIPFNNSLYCYCNLWYEWAGPECSQLSSTSIGIGVSNLLIGAVALALAIWLVVDAIILRRYSARADAREAYKHGPSKSTLVARVSKSTESMAKLTSCYGSDGERNRVDMHMVTSVMLFLALVMVLGLMLVDTIRNWMLETCVGENGVRQNCLLVLNSVFFCIGPILIISVTLLLSVLMYNASFRANGLSYLPCTSFWTLMVLVSASFVTSILSVVLNNKAIASYAGACFALLPAFINLMTCYRLRDFTFIKHLVRCSPCAKFKDSSSSGESSDHEPSRQWTIRQRLMAISMAVFFLTLLIAISLILRGIFLRVPTAQVALVTETIFRWANLGVLTVYFILIHYNSQQRIHVMAQRLKGRTRSRTRLNSSQPQLSEVQPNSLDFVVRADQVQLA